MSENDLLAAIANIVQAQVAPIHQKLAEMDQRFDVIDQRLAEMDHKFDVIDQRLAEMDHKFDVIEQKFAKMEQQINTLSQQVTSIQLTIENNIIPRLQTIESCYLDTFKRYQKGVDQIDDMQSDIDTLKKTVKSHSEKLEKTA